MISLAMLTGAALGAASAVSLCFDHVVARVRSRVPAIFRKHESWYASRLARDLRRRLRGAPPRATEDLLRQCVERHNFGPLARLEAERVGKLAVQTLTLAPVYNIAISMFILFAVGVVDYFIGGTDTFRVGLQMIAGIYAFLAGAGLTGLLMSALVRSAASRERGGLLALLYSRARWRRIRAHALAETMRLQRPEFANLAPSAGTASDPDALWNLYANLRRCAYVFDVESRSYVPAWQPPADLADPEAATAEVRAETDAMLAENEHLVFAPRIEGFVGMSDAPYYVKGETLYLNFWDEARQIANVMKTERLVLGARASGLNYDRALAAVLAELENRDLRPALFVRDELPLSENLRRQVDAFRVKTRCHYALRATATRNLAASQSMRNAGPHAHFCIFSHVRSARSHTFRFALRGVFAGGGFARARQLGFGPPRPYARQPANRSENGPRRKEIAPAVRRRPA